MLDASVFGIESRRLSNNAEPAPKERPAGL